MPASDYWNINPFVHDYNGGLITYTGAIAAESIPGMPGWVPFIPPASTPAPNPPALTPPQPNPTTPGIDLSKLRNATYGKKIPISALGLARIGGAIIVGPYLNGTTASFGISFGFPADPTGTRQLREIAFDSKVAWTLADGFTGEPFTFRFYPGRQDQDADPLEIANFPDAPVAYRPQMLLFFEDLPLSPFDDKIPYVAAVIGDTTDGADPADGINLGTALERLAYSPWTLYDSSTFETVNIVDVIGGILLADDYSFLQLGQYIGRIYRNLDILQSDKLRIRDHGALVDPDIAFDPSRIVVNAKPVQFMLQESSLTTRELELITIDPDADYMWVPSKAQRPRVPIPTTASVGKDTVTLPLVMNAATRISMVYFAQYAEESARKKVSFTAMAYGLDVQPGDRVALMSLGSGIDDEVFKITQTTHGANHIVQIEAEAIMRCRINGIPPPPDGGGGGGSKVYFEATFANMPSSGTWGAGITSGSQSLAGINPGSGFAFGSAFLTLATINSICFVDNHFKFNLGHSVSGDRICVALDMINRNVWFRRNGEVWNNSALADPAANVGGFDISAILPPGAVAFAVATTQGFTAPSSTANFGASSFAYAIPSGFMGYGSAVAWNPADKTPFITLSGGNLVVTTANAGYSAVRSDAGIS